VTTPAATGSEPARTTGLVPTLAVIAGLHILGIGLLVMGVLTGPIGGITVGLALTAYLMGLRHAADADHISMIDNSTRRFVARGHRHASVGLAFSAGHSTVVIAAGIAVVAGASWIRSVLAEGSSAAAVLGIIGGSVAALYLFAVAAANLPQILAAAQAIRDGGEVTAPRGVAARVLDAPLAKVTHPAHIYVFGLLFGLGFDTASSVSLLMLTGAATVGVPGGVAGVGVGMLALPVMFAAAMTLGDTANALMMLRMYTAAVSDRRRAWFNLVITTVSVTSAVVIATITVSGVLGELGVSVPALAWLGAVDTEWWGVGLIGLFLVVGLVAVVHRRAIRRQASTT